MKIEIFFILVIATNVLAFKPPGQADENSSDSDDNTTTVSLQLVVRTAEPAELPRQNPDDPPRFSAPSILYSYEPLLPDPDKGNGHSNGNHKKTTPGPAVTQRVFARAMASINIQNLGDPGAGPSSEPSEPGPSSASEPGPSEGPGPSGPSGNRTSTSTKRKIEEVSDSSDELSELSDAPHDNTDEEEDEVNGGTREKREDESSECESLDSIVEGLHQYDIDEDMPIWNHYVFDTGSYNREELQIIEVNANKRLNLDRQIKEWVSMKNHAIGRGTKGLTIVTSTEDGIKINNLDADKNVSCMCLFEWWDQEEKSMAIGLLTSQDATINWERLDGDMLTDITNIWQWQLNRPIIHMAIYKLDNQWKVAVTHEQNVGNDRVIDIYGVDLLKDWWFEGKLSGYGKPVIINNGRYIAVIMKDYATVTVYKYDYEKRRYFEHKTFLSPEVENISAFVVGTSSFLAIGGEKPAIYEVRGDQFVEMDVHDYQLNHVELYLPIELGYYRNDALILFQHKLDHSSHSSSVLEALQWDGSKFTILDHSPCRSHDEEMYGFSCILDAEGEKGIKGASAFRTVDGENHVLTASEEYTPIMFNIKTQLVDLPNPLVDEYKQIVKAKSHLQDRFLMQERIMRDAEKLAETDTEYFTTDNLRIKEIYTPSLHIEGNIRDSLFEDGYINVAGQDWRSIDLNMDTSMLFDRFKENHDRIKDVVRKLKNALMLKDPIPEVMESVKITGDIVAMGNVKVESAHIEVMNGLKVDDVLEHAVRHRDSDTLVINGELIVDNLKMPNVQAEKINGISMNEENKEVYTIYGNLEIGNHLHVLGDVNLNDGGTINGIDFKKDIITSSDDMNSDLMANFLNFDQLIVENEFIVENTMNGYNFTKEGFDEIFERKWEMDNEKLLKMEELKLDSLVVGENLAFNNINDISWKEYTDSLVLTDQDGSLDDLEVGGVVTVDRDLGVEILNTLAYPDDYLLIEESSPVVFTAPKTFANGLQADEVDCEETISGIVPEDIVTLSTRQNLNNFTFFDLTVTERMNVQGDITGKELNEFLSNPHLTDVKQIKSNVIFRNLRINGTLKVANRINETRWEDIFDGVIMKSESPVRIDSFKTFEGSIFVENGLNIRSGFLNNRRVSEFLTKDTEQVIPQGVLNGDITFGNLNVGGLFDGVNVTELAENSVKLSGDQTIMADMIFDDSFDLDQESGEERSVLPLEVSNLNVKKLCNEWKPEEALFLEEPIEFHSPQFKNLYAEKLVVDGNLISNDDSFCGVNLKQFDKVRLSKSFNKDILAPYTIMEAYIDKLSFKTLNGVSESDMADFNKRMTNINDEVLYKDGFIGTLKITGHLNVSKINGADLRKIADGAIWIKEDNNLNGDFKLMDEVSTESLKIYGNAYGKNFDDYISDLVQLDQDPIVLKGKKFYTSGLDVLENITTDYLNGHQVSDIMLYSVDQNIKGNLNVNGDLIVRNDLNVKGLLQGIDIKKIGESFEYLENNIYHVKSDVTFYQDLYINNLIINGVVNDVYDLKSIVNSTVKNSNNNYFGNTITFLKPVQFKSGLKTKLYNGYDMSNIMNDIVMIDDDVSINSMVIFEQPLEVEGKIYADELMSEVIQYCNINEWKNNAIYLNEKQEITGIKHFENLTIKGNAFIKTLNNIPFDNFITLNTNQTILKGLNLNRLLVKSAVDVSGFVNGLKLDEVIKNTLMKTGNQVIETPIHFHSNVIVQGDTYLGMVNSKDFSKAVHIKSENDLYGQYNFKGNVYFEKNLNISGSISNVNPNNLLNEGVFTNDYGDNIIKGNWNITGNLVFENNITGTPSIHGLSLENINSYLSYKNTAMKHHERYLKWHYRRMCHIINRLNKVLEKHLYTFNRIEEIQRIPDKDLLSVHNFLHAENMYLLMVEKLECLGSVWIFNVESGYYGYKSTIEMGCATKWHTVKTAQFLYFLSENSNDCKCNATGVSIWSFDGINLQLVQNLPPVESVHVAEGNEGYFGIIESKTMRLYQIQDAEGKYKCIEINAIPKVDSLRFLNAVLLPNKLLMTNEKKLLQYSIKDKSIKETAIVNKVLATVTEMITTFVGKNSKKIFVACTPNDGNYGISIYDNLQNEAIQKIECKNPSSLKTMQLNNYQTLFFFIENFTRIKVYVYHGFQGFKYLYDYKLHSTKLDVITNGTEKYLTITTNRGVIIGKVIMHGQKFEIDALSCVK